MNDIGGPSAWGYFPPDVVPQEGREGFVPIEDAVEACRQSHQQGIMEGAMNAFEGLARLSPLKLLRWQWRARRLLRDKK